MALPTTPLAPQSGPISARRINNVIVEFYRVRYLNPVNRNNNNCAGEDNADEQEAVMKARATTERTPGNRVGYGPGFRQMSVRKESSCCTDIRLRVVRLIPVFPTRGRVISHGEPRVRFPWTSGRTNKRQLSMINKKIVSRRVSCPWCPGNINARGKVFPSQQNTTITDVRDV